jgi:hypothetical protein
MQRAETVQNNECSVSVSQQAAISDFGKYGLKNPFY